MGELSRIFELTERGETESFSKDLVALAYNELRHIAANMMSHERPDHTLQATALVHEAYIRLLDSNGKERSWNGPGHFFSAAAEAMRRILIESARRKNALRRGGGVDHTQWNDSRIGVTAPDDELLAVNDALIRLEAEDPELATVVKLRYFVGLSIPETATALGKSPRTIDREWGCAKSWLYREIGAPGRPVENSG